MTRLKIVNCIHAELNFHIFQIFVLWKCPQGDNEAVEEAKEESDEDEEEDEESGRMRFKSERKEGPVVRLADAGRKNRNIPETLGNSFSCWSPFMMLH